MLLEGLWGERNGIGEKKGKIRNFLASTLDEHSCKGSWEDLVWIGTGRAEITIVHVDRCLFLCFKRI